MQTTPDAFAPVAAPKLEGCVSTLQINEAYMVVLHRLNSTVEASLLFVEACDYAGGLLRAKKVELGHRNWLPYLAEYCPTISEVTARRLMGINEMLEEKRSCGNDLDLVDLQGPIGSVRAVYELLIANIEKKPVSTKQQTPAARLNKSLKRFWGLLSKRPAAKWDREEKRQFLQDLAGRKHIADEQGWEIPIIDVKPQPSDAAW